MTVNQSAPQTRIRTRPSKPDQPSAVVPVTRTRVRLRALSAEDPNPDPRSPRSNVARPAEREGEVYKVGKGRPPLEYRFRQGEVHNPNGRSKGSKNTSTLFREELDRKVIVKTAKGNQKMTKRAIAARKMVDKAANGDLKALEAALRLEGVHLSSVPASEPKEAVGEVLDATDQAILAFMRQQTIDAYLQSKEKPTEAGS